MEEMKKGNYWHGLISLSSSKKNCLWLFFEDYIPSVVARMVVLVFEKK